MAPETNAMPAAIACLLERPTKRRGLMKKNYVFLFMIIFFGTPIAACMSVITPISEPVKAAAPGKKVPSCIMLVLGSSDPATRATRVGLACALLKREDIHFDKIILSGGCGAHGTDSSNCEASDMERLLESGCSDRISGIQIYKEENSGSTVQNYCNSRNLKTGGEEVIKKEDTLYVVSSHYHALSVAACFKNNGVDAHYYYTCGGNLYDGVPPSLKEVAASTTPCLQDYSGIAQNCGNTDYCGGQD
jgi:hypothetical protein